MAVGMDSPAGWPGCGAGTPLPSSGTAPGEKGRRGERSCTPECSQGCTGWGAGVTPTLPSPEDEAILRSCSCSVGAVAYCASSYSTLVRGGLVMSR